MGVWRNELLKSNTNTNAVTLRKTFSSIMLDIIARGFIINTLPATFGLSCANVLDNSALLLPGRFRLHIIVIKKPGCPTLLETATISCICQCIFRNPSTCVNGRTKTSTMTLHSSHLLLYPNHQSILAIYCSQTCSLR